VDQRMVEGGQYARGRGPIYPRNRRTDRTPRVAARACRGWDSLAWWQGGRALVRRRSTVTTGTVKGTRGVEILSVRRRRDGELDKEGAAVATWHAQACQRSVPTCA
jgi:hypothetical protein